MPAARVKGIRTHRCLLLLAAGDMGKMNDQLCGPIVKDVEEGQLPIKPWSLVSFSKSLCGFSQVNFSPVRTDRIRVLLLPQI